MRLDINGVAHNQPSGNALGKQKSILSAESATRIWVRRAEYVFSVLKSQRRVFLNSM
jgi:hypothetical protein